ncbi:MAG: hypothetical protein ACOCR0_03440 [Haloferacaceae archaeon]
MSARNHRDGSPIRRLGDDADPWRVGRRCHAVTGDGRTYIQDRANTDAWVESDVAVDPEAMR